MLMDCLRATYSVFKWLFGILSAPFNAVVAKALHRATTTARTANDVTVRRSKRPWRRRRRAKTSRRKSAAPTTPTPSMKRRRPGERLFYSSLSSCFSFATRRGKQMRWRCDTDTMPMWWKCDTDAKLIRFQCNTNAVQMQYKCNTDDILMRCRDFLAVPQT